jgi:3-oxoacyl-[acyl-carrier protein] reductase
MNLNLKNKKALVLSSSKGIGFAIAKSLASEGCQVMMTSSSKKNLILAKKKIIHETGEEVETFQLNIHNLNSVKKNLKQILKSGKIDILILNAPGPKPISLVNSKFKDFQDAANQCFLNLIYICQEVIQKKYLNKNGRIINLSSTTGLEPADDMVLSNITRSALISYIKTASKELSKNSITFNSILTGGVMTDRTTNLLKIHAKKNKLNYKKVLRQASESIPAGFIAEPDYFVNFIIFLCSPLSGYLNGAAIPLDGGLMKSL